MHAGSMQVEGFQAKLGPDCLVRVKSRKPGHHLQGPKRPVRVGHNWRRLTSADDWKEIHMLETDQWRLMIDNKQDAV